jgi:hypothetical protein
MLSDLRFCNFFADGGLCCDTIKLEVAVADGNMSKDTNLPGL